MRQARAANERRALVLAGQRAWCTTAARTALVPGLEPVLWVTDGAPEAVWALPAEEADTVLGREVGAVVFDAHAGFNPDAFGAISGTLCGGGLLLLLIPPLASWPRFQDPDYLRMVAAGCDAGDVGGRFLQRLLRVMRDDDAVRVVEQGRINAGPVPGATPAPQVSAAVHDVDAAGCVTDDQRRAVDALVRVGLGRARRPVVLTSDRGRGKSAALGIAAAALIREGLTRIVVTGPRLQAVERVFEHAARRLPDALASRAALHWGEARMEFLPPDRLLHDGSHEAQLLLVDEAAAIPAPVLEQLLERYSRIAFATTVHGYEGTGRGFALRFNRVLDVRTPEWKALQLETPVRWAPDDPLERFVFRALLLDAAAASDDAVAGATAAGVQVERMGRDVLAGDEATLSELFGLLVLAHYRTRPFDLRLLLDGPNVSVYALRHDGHVVGTALVADEGGFDAGTTYGIWAGHTRPQGHLLPESLAAHAGLEQAPRLRCGRILRIAVHPHLQGRGLGTRLLAALAQAAADDGCDYIGSSFGATEPLLRFWHHGGFEPVRLSVTRGASSGAHSAVVLRPLSDAGRCLADAARRRFREQFLHQLGDPLRELEAPLALRLLRDDRSPGFAALDADDWRDLVAFGFGRRIYEAAMAAIWKLARAAVADGVLQEQLQPAQCRVLVVKVLQRNSWADAARVLGVAGRGGVQQLLRSAVRAVVERGAGAEVRNEARRLAALWDDSGT